MLRPRGSYSTKVSSSVIRPSHSGSGRSRTKVSSISIPKINPLFYLIFRVHSHAASALINFCEGVERDTLLPYLDPIVERLMRLLRGERRYMTLAIQINFQGSCSFLIRTNVYMY
jgi:hypothetical protein